MSNEANQKIRPRAAEDAGAERKGYIVNDPFRGNEFIANKSLTQEDVAKLEAAIPQGERLLFVIIGDLNIHSKYAKSMLAVTDKLIYGFDQAFPEGVKTHSYDKVKRAYAKRYYANAMLILSMDDSKSEYVDRSKEYTNFIRFSNKVASLYDAAARFIQNVAAGNDIEDELRIVAVAFEKQFCVCPKCGRTLIRPGAQCMNCQSKNKVVAKLAKYILPYKYELLFCMLLAIITTGVALVPPYMTRMLVDDVLPNGRKDKLLMCVLMLLVTYVVQYGVGAIRSYRLKVAGDKIVADLRNDVYEKAQHLPMRFYDRTSTGSVINRISGDSNTIQAFMLRVTQEVVVQFFQLVGIIVIMFTMNWQLTLLSLIPVPFVVMGSRTFGKKIHPYYRRIWRRWTAVTSILTDTIPGIRVIKAFANEKRSVDNFVKYNGEWLKTDIKASKITTLFPNIVGFVVTCGSLLIWGVGGSLVIDDPGFVSAGLLVSFISYTSMFYGPVNFFANFNDSYQGALNAAERILDIIDAEPEVDFAKGKHPDRLKGRIEFKNVNFSFDRSKKTLSNVNLVIEPGDIVGIVGTTGAGKSTLINLLMRYYDHYDGEILMDGINIKDIDMEFYRSEIGYVQQEPMMFHETIYKNIAYGVENVQVEQVIHAAEVANAHEFIARLPDGYDTLLGERGIGLSGGERQRLSIARAVLKNPSILFLDEATASVDSETESLIQDAIDNLIHGRTTLMIAHRLSTLRKANKIIVVDKGEIIEMGSPEELIALQGKYYKLVQIQTMSDQTRKMKEEERFD
ncbi:MAG: ABC transporter ATP-binding protein [Lachnospiraceae bacterium]|nr:ABC transporter ATP-binding protein [Lachnospiraceae bacterium]